MVAAGDRAEELVEADAAFHDVIARRAGQRRPAALLRSLSTSTVRARLWHGVADRGALDLAREEHARDLRGDRRRRRRARPRRDAAAHRHQRDVGCASTSAPPTTCRSTVTERVGARLMIELGRWGSAPRPSAACTRPVEDETAHAVVERAWELGVRYFDTAPLYGAGLAERRLGAALRGRPRDEFVVSTKVGRLLRPGKSAWHGAPALVAYFDFSHDAALRSLEESLGRLGLDRVDVALRTRPRRPLRRGARRRLPAPCARLRDEGVVRAIGVGHEPDGDALPLRARGRPRLLPRRRPLHGARPQRRSTSSCRSASERGIAVIAGGVFNSGVLAGGDTYDYDDRAAGGDRRASSELRRDVRRHGVPLRRRRCSSRSGIPPSRLCSSAAAHPTRSPRTCGFRTSTLPDALWEDLA